MGTGTGKDNEGKGIEYSKINSTTRGTGTGIDKERLEDKIIPIDSYGDDGGGDREYGKEMHNTKQIVTLLR